MKEKREGVVLSKFRIYQNNKSDDGNARRKNNTRIFGILVAVLCLIGFFVTKQNEKNTIEQTYSVENNKYEDIHSLVSDNNGPESGTILFQKYKSNPAKLHVINDSEADVCIKCNDGLLNRNVIQFYVRAKDEARVEVPVGYFELHAARTR